MEGMGAGGGGRGARGWGGLTLDEDDDHHCPLILTQANVCNTIRLLEADATCHLFLCCTWLEGCTCSPVERQDIQPGGQPLKMMPRKC